MRGRVAFFAIVAVAAVALYAGALASRMGRAVMHARGGW